MDGKDQLDMSEMKNSDKESLQQSHQQIWHI